jgi:AcrR family transcriptional regulator
MDNKDSETRLRILGAALKRFAYSGYAGVSVQDIVDDALVTKPTLYYYFQSKSGLYQALLEWAYDERFRILQKAASRHKLISDRLTSILIDMFKFLQRNRDLMRLAFATAFAAPGEIPEQIDYLKKANRNFEFLQTIFAEELKAGGLNARFTSHELTMGFFGCMNIHVMSSLVNPKFKKLGPELARKIVRLYLEGASARK